MILHKPKNIKNQSGFTFVEVLTYLFIFSMLILIICSLVISIFNARKQLQASNYVYQNARFIVSFLSNRVHNVDWIDDVSPATETLHFYQLPDKRFSIKLDNNNLIYQETQDTGSGYPDQSTADPVMLNNNSIQVTSLLLTPVSDSRGNINQGVKIDFTLSIGGAGDKFGYIVRPFSTFISVR